MNITLAALNMNSSHRQAKSEKYPYLDSRQDVIAFIRFHAANSVYGKAIRKSIVLFIFNPLLSAQNTDYP